MSFSHLHDHIRAQRPKKLPEKPSVAWQASSVHVEYSVRQHLTRARLLKQEETMPEVASAVTATKRKEFTQNPCFDFMVGDTPIGFSRVEMVSSFNGKVSKPHRGHILYMQFTPEEITLEQRVEAMKALITSYSQEYEVPLYSSRSALTPNAWAVWERLCDQGIASITDEVTDHCYPIFKFTNV